MSIDFERPEKNLFKIFFGLAAIMVLAWLLFWGTVVGVGVFLLFKYVI